MSLELDFSVSFLSEVSNLKIITLYSVNHQFYSTLS